MFSNNAERRTLLQRDYEDTRACSVWPSTWYHTLIDELHVRARQMAQQNFQPVVHCWCRLEQASNVYTVTRCMRQSICRTGLLEQFRGDLELLCDLRHIVDQVIYIDCSRCGAATRSTNATWTERCRVVHFGRISVYLNGDLNLISACMDNLWLKDAEDVPHCPNNCNLYLPAHR